MKAFKAFIKPFKAPQRSENKVNFYYNATSEMNGVGRVYARVNT